MTNRPLKEHIASYLRLQQEALGKRFEQENEIVGSYLVEVIAGAPRFAGEAVDLCHDPALFRERRQPDRHRLQIGAAQIVDADAECDLFYIITVGSCSSEQREPVSQPINSWARYCAECAERIPFVLVVGSRSLADDCA